MKKVLFLILGLVLALGLALPMAAPAGAHMEGCPFTTDLLAGQDIDVGDVSVWNDATTLYVKYETTGGWEMTETHLHVATSLEDIPQTQAKGKGKGNIGGNPIPGHFSDGDYYDPPVTNDTFTFNLTDEAWEPCNDLCIAAHAVVVKMGETQTTCVVSDNGTLITKVYNKAGGGNAVVDLSGAPMNAVEAYEPKPYPTGYPVEPPETTDSVWDNGVNWFEDNGSAADWIWETHLAEGPTSYDINSSLYDADAARWGRVVLLETGFDIPGIPTSATLHIAADNAYEFWLNGGTSTRSATAAGGAGWENSSLHESNVHTSGWQTVGPYDVLGDLTTGSNTLYVLAGNEYFWGDDSLNFDNPTRSDPYAQYNPGAAIFELCVDWARLQRETAWGNGDDFPGKNWATYFEYHVQFPMALEGTGNYTAEWETDPDYVKSLPCSIHLATANFTGPPADEARIVISLPNGTTLGDIESISWWTYLVSGYVPHVDLILDCSGNGTRDHKLVAEGAYQNGDLTTGWASPPWFKTFHGVTAAYPSWSGLTGTPNLTQVDGTTAVWLSPAPSPPGPPNQLSIAKLSDYQSVAGLYGVSGSTIVLALEIEVDNWVVQSEAYVDDIEINLGS